MLEITYHHVRQSYVIGVYAYDLPAKIPKTLDPCCGGFWGNYENPITFPDKKKGLPHVKTFLENALECEVVFQ